MGEVKAIGVFDSGLGGLTVLSAIHDLLPNEPTIYLGDTARVPYGSKSAELVTQYALENAEVLMKTAPLKLLVVACNTASAVALGALRERFQIPIIGVIESGVEAAVVAGADSVSVLATKATVQSEAYPNEFKKQGFKGRVSTQACPLWAPFVEERITKGRLVEEVVQLYLKKLPEDVEACVLGCTHYPLLLPVLKKAGKKNMIWVNGAVQAAKKVQEVLKLKNLKAQNIKDPLRKFLVTDDPKRFKESAGFYMGKDRFAEDVTLAKTSI